MSAHTDKVATPDIVELIRSTLSRSIPAHIGDEAVLKLNLNDIAADSLDKLDLILRLEKTYSILLDEIKIAECQTLADLVDLVNLSRKDNQSE